MMKMGYPNCMIFVEFRIFKIDRDFIERATRFTGSKPSPEKLISSKLRMVMKIRFPETFTTVVLSLKRVSHQKLYPFFNANKIFIRQLIVYRIQP
jgi:hypothetical protein